MKKNVFQKKYNCSLKMLQKANKKVKNYQLSMCIRLVKRSSEIFLAENTTFTIKMLELLLAHLSRRLTR